MSFFNRYDGLFVLLICGISVRVLQTQQKRNKTRPAEQNTRREKIRILARLPLGHGTSTHVKSFFFLHSHGLWQLTIDAIGVMRISS